MLKLTRVGSGPIMRPRPDVAWEKSAVLNAAAVYDTSLGRGKYHLLYRAVAHNPRDRNRSCIGYAWSDDGIHFQRLDEPVLRSKETLEEAQGVEDPRVTRLDDGYAMLYTAYDLRHIQIALATSQDLVTWQRHGVVIPDTLFGSNKDGALFPEKIGGRYCMLHRPDPEIYIAFSEELDSWTDKATHMRLMQPEFDWEATKIGAGAQPIRTEKGWLLIYHGVDARLWYRLGVALLDLDDPTRVIARQAEPILEPEADWELTGDVNNVVFTCGAVLLGRELWVYYGAADTVIGLAKGNIDDFLSTVA